MLNTYWQICLVGMAGACLIGIVGARLLLCCITKRKLKRKGKRFGIRVHMADGEIENLTQTVRKKLVIGRSDFSDLYFDDEKISRRHFEISYKKGNLYIRDLGTTNGTLVNGIEVKIPRKLQPGDQIQAGETRFIVGW